ncbi:MAG: phosphoribosyltransferase [Oscillatoriophycideae cyanobacterium NC_groundwater_1537_Pr4_S-0.65um_50_18]|nr:phosphoribosyltransferase [Oscillatoriophycideae cyanobacterium NC_groundwater_1537_Pr4_S-0.65um_50_18]
MATQRPYQARFIPKGEPRPALEPPYRDAYPVLLRDGSCLELPLQPFPEGQMAIALLMSNQTPFTVEQGLAPLLSELAAAFAPEAIVGIPTLGLDYARLVAQQLKLPGYTALGNSRKFWYEDALSVPVVSITSPDVTKRLYLDPSLVDRVAGKRTVIVDDVINTGGTAEAAIQLLRQVGAKVEGLVVVLTEGQDWQQRLQAIEVDWQNTVQAVGHIPLFQRTEAGWMPIPAALG